MRELQEYIDKASVLVEALPYIQSFRGKVIVVKYGGSTMRPDGQPDTVLHDIVFMESVGMKPVIVHGGGPAIDRRLKESGLATKRVNGLRVTDEATMKVVEETLFGEVNADIVGQVEGLGGRPVGVSARDAGVMFVRRHLAQGEDGPVDIGFVGDVERIDPGPILDLLSQGMIPVIAPIGQGENGVAYNVNADTAAGEIAAGLHAEKLVFLTDVTGIMKDPEDPDSLISTVHINQAEGLVAEEIIVGGMIPKVWAGVHSVKAGVRKTHIIDGRIAHSMLLEFFTDEGVGTQIVQ
ncbi:acetylglutamate kinase [Candidatus Latescibacterota bacterium]